MHGEEFFNQLPGREISELCYRFRKLRKLNLVSLRSIYSNIENIYNKNKYT